MRRDVPGVLAISTGSLCTRGHCVVCTAAASHALAKQRWRRKGKLATLGDYALRQPTLTPCLAGI